MVVPIVMSTLYTPVGLVISTLTTVEPVKGVIGAFVMSDRSTMASPGDEVKSRPV